MRWCAVWRQASEFRSLASSSCHRLQTSYNAFAHRKKKDGIIDVTLYIEKGDKLIVIAKHPYPPDYFARRRQDSSRGIIYGGINREAHEETGCNIEVLRFLLKTSVNFHTTAAPTERCHLAVVYFSGEIPERRFCLYR